MMIWTAGNTSRAYDETAGINAGNTGRAYDKESRLLQSSLYLELWENSDMMNKLLFLCEKKKAEGDLISLNF